MTNLVKRLREKAFRTETYELVNAAADRIETLEAELVRTFKHMMRDASRIEKLESALREITESARLVGDYYHVKIARKALEGKDAPQEPI